jgi:hypothetical protein
LYTNDQVASSDGANFFDFADRHDFALVRVHPGAKNPVGDGWQNLASRNPADWKQWHAEGFNTGVHAGASRLVIFDLDQKHGGIEAVRERFDVWCRERGMASLPHHVTTASGGQHVFMQVPEGVDAMALAPNLRGTIGKGVDVLTADRQSVAPGSFFNGAEGKPAGLYTFHDAPLYSASQSVIDFCTRALSPEAPPVVKVGAYEKSDVAGLVDWLAERDEFEEYQDWVNLGMAVKLEYGDDGKEIWARSHNETVMPDVIATKWRSFDSEAKPHAVTLATFMKRGHDLGWTGRLRQADVFKGCAEFATAAGAPGMPTIESPPLAPAATAIPVPQTQDELAGEANATMDALPDLFRSSGEFADEYIAPDYLVDGIFQCGFLYSITAQTGGGKTAKALRLIAHIATGQPFCGHDVEKGQVLYMAGENSVDVQQRWIGQCMEMGLDPKALDVLFTSRPKKLTELIPRLEREVARKHLKPVAIIVDTAAAHFSGENENDNNENGEYARQLRTLCDLPGNPCVVVLCHPTKNAKDIGDMVPRGGGAFLNEVDGNIGLVRNGTTIIAVAIGKFRGSEFAPLNFALKTIDNHPRLKTTRGKQISTVVAVPISHDEVQRQEETGRKNEDKVLELLCNNPKGTIQADIAKALSWYANKAKRALESLEQEKLVACTRGFWTATEKGQKHLNNTAAHVPTGPSLPGPPPGAAPMPPPKL